MLQDAPDIYFRQGLEVETRKIQFMCEIERGKGFSDT